MENSEILIISFTFPPEQAIGGRRWEKLAGYLSEHGFKVNVICAQGEGNESFYKTNFPKLNIKSINSGYPYFLKQPDSIFNKLRYHFFLKFISPFSKQNFFDKGVFWKRKLLKAANQIIKDKKISHVITTGAPFSALFFTCQLKIKHPNIKYIADLRDPWTWGTGYGMQGLSSRKKKWQHFQEKEVIKQADLITYPAESMGEYLKRSYPESSGKFYQLTHAWDPVDFEIQKVEVESEKSETISFVYGGTLYDGTEKLFEALNELKALNYKFLWQINTFNSSKRKQVIDLGLENEINIESVVDSRTFYSKVGLFNYYLIYFPERYKDFLSTKFYEVFYSGIPVIFIGYEGVVSNFIEKFGFGVVIKPHEIAVKLGEIMDGKIKFPSANREILSEFSYLEVTKKFISKLQSI